MVNGKKSFTPPYATVLFVKQMEISLFECNNAMDPLYCTPSSEPDGSRPRPAGAPLTLLIYPGFSFQFLFAGTDLYL